MTKFTHSQENFIKKWNAIAHKLSSIPVYKKLPKLSTEGSCTGFSFMLAFYAKNNDEPNFHKFYEFICEHSQRRIVEAFKLNFQIRSLLNEYETLDKSITSGKVSKSHKNQKKLNKLDDEIKKKKKKRDELFPNLKSSDYQKIIDFIYSVYILQEKQTSSQVVGKKEQQEQNLDNMTDLATKDKILDRALARTYGNSWNHLRIGGRRVEKENEHYGKIGFNNLKNKIAFPQIIASLKGNEPKSANDPEKSQPEILDIGIADGKTDSGHSVTVYKYDGKYHIFDSNIGKRTTVDTPEEAASEVIYSTNLLITNFTEKYTLFDKLWNESNLFKAAAIAFLPFTAIWVGYDLLFAKPESKEKLRDIPLRDSVWLTWSKVSPAVDPEIEQLKSAQAQASKCSTNVVHQQLCANVVPASGGAVNSTSTTHTNLASNTVANKKQRPSGYTLPPGAGAVQVDAKEETIKYSNYEPKFDEIAICINAYNEFKNDKYFGLGCFTKSKQTQAVQKILRIQVDENERFRIAKEYVDKYPEKDFSKILKANIPALNKSVILPESQSSQAAPSSNDSLTTNTKRIAS